MVIFETTNKQVHITKQTKLFNDLWVFFSKQLTFPVIPACHFATIQNNGKHKLMRKVGVDSHGHWQAVRKRTCAEPYGSVYTNRFSSMVSLYHQHHDALKVILVETTLHWNYSSHRIPELYLSVRQELKCWQVKEMQVKSVYHDWNKTCSTHRSFIHCPIHQLPSLHPGFHPWQQHPGLF